VAANTRRVEALTGVAAYLHTVEMRLQMRQAESKLRAQPGSLIEAAGSAAERLARQEERLAAFEAQSRANITDSLLDAVERSDDVGILVAKLDEMAPDELRGVAAQLRDKIGSGIGIVGSRRGPKAGLVAFATRDLVDRGLDAGQMLAPVAKILGGGGSRDPELAQAGGPNGELLEEALDEANRVLREAVSGL